MMQSVPIELARLVGDVTGRSWSCPSRPRVDKHPTQDKLLFEASS